VLDEKQMRLRIYSGSRGYSWRIKRYGNLLPLLDFVETVKNLSKERVA
jgi:hypothetical protein